MILMIKVIFRTNYHEIIRSFQGFIKIFKWFSANIKLSQTRMSKMVQLGGSVFDDQILGPFNPFKILKFNR